MKNKILSFALPLLLALSPVAAPAARLLWVDVRGSATVEDGDTNPTVGEYRSSGTGHSVNAFRVSVPDAEASGGTNRLVFAYEENGSMVVGGSEPVVRSLDFANGGALWAPLDLAAYADRDLVVTMELGYVDPANDSSFEKLAFATEHLGSLLDAPHVSIQSDLNPPALTPWAPETFTVTVPWAIAYDLAGGTNNAANPEFYTEGQLPIALLPAGREGYTFAGWTNELGAVVEEIAAGSTGDRSFGATWLENVEPPAGANFIYDGTAKTGVPSGTGYSVAGDATATEPGQYTVTLSLESGYIWSDGTTEDKTVAWSIAPAVAMTLSVPDETTGVVTTNYFATLQDAIDATASSDPVATNVVLRGDVEETVVVTNSVAIDLAGHKLDGDVTNAVPAVVATSVPGGGITGDIVSEGDSARLAIEGGEFDGELSAPDGGSISITGGHFAQDPSDYVADGYYAAGDDTGGYDVLPCRSILDTTITVASAEYTGVSQVPAVTVETNGVALVLGTDFTVAYETNALVNADTYAIVVNGIGAWKDSFPTNFVITAKSVTITVAGTPSSAVYNGENQTTNVAYVATSESALFDESKVQYSGAATVSGTTIGSYPYGLVNTQFTYDDANIDATFNVTDAAFAITKAQAMVTAEAKSKTYGETDPEFTAVVTGLKGEDTASLISYTLSRDADEDVGSYAITPAGDAVQGNYDVVYVPADLTIAKRAITVTAADASKVAGNADPTFSASITKGSLAAGDEIAYTLQREAGETVGDYAIAPTVAITAAGADKSANYEVTLANGTFTIGDAAAMVISVADASTGATTTNYVAVLADAFGPDGAKDGDTVELLADATLDARLEPNLGAGTTLVIDLAGHKITRTGTTGNGSAFDVKSGAVTIRNGTIDCTQNDADIAKDGVYAITARSGAAVTLADLDVTVDSQAGACVYPFAGATVAIKSGTYANVTDRPYQYHDGWTGMAVNQANVAQQLITITGGTFSQVDPALGDDSAAEGAMSFIDESYVTVSEGGAWVVHPAVTVTFADAKVSPAPAAQKIAQGSTATEPSPAPAATGYDFGGWFADLAAGPAWNFADAVDEDLALEAKWTPVVYALSYDLAGGAVSPADANPATYTIEDADIALVNPTKTGYEFAGWTGTGLDAASAAVTIATGSTGDRSYEATWTPADVDYTVQHWKADLGGATFTLAESETLQGKTESLTEAAAKTYEGFVAGAVTQAAIAADGSTVVRIEYARETYAVVWKNWDGTVLETDAAVEYGARPSYDGATPERPADENGVYTFTGWEPGILATTVVTGDATYTATFSQGDVSAMVISVAGTKTYYATLAEAVAAADDGETVRLMHDVTLDARIEPDPGAGAALTIDLAGHKITRTGTSGNGSAFDVKSGAVTIRNGAIDCMQDDAAIAKDGVYAITARSGAAVTLADLSVTVDSECGATVYPFAGATVAIESGAYANTTTTPYRYKTDWTGMAVNQANGQPGSLFTITGGSFSQVNPMLGDDSAAEGAMSFVHADYYAVGEGGGVFTVVPRIDIARATVTVKDDLVYDGTAQAGVASVAYGTTNLVEGTDYVVTYATNVDAGTETAVATLVGTNLWTGTQIAKFSIAQKPLTVTAASDTKVYDGTALENGAYTATALAAGDAFQAVTVAGSQTGVGASSNRVTAVAVTNALGAVVTANYAVATADGELTVTKAALTITVAAQTKVYGDADPELTYSVEGLKAGDALSGALTRDAGEDVGTYAIGQGTLTAGDNYEVSYVGANLTITKATATVTAEAKSKTYGDADPALTATVTGLKGGDAASAIAYTLSRAAGETVGAYAITPAGAAEQGNYDVVYVPADLTIAKRAITVTAADVSKVAGNADPTFSASITEGSLAAGDEIAYTLQREAGETVGDYAIAPTVAITAAGVDQSANYEVTLANGTFTIGGAAAMVISVADASTGATTTNYVAVLADAFGLDGAKDGDTVELLADATLDARIEPNLGAGTTLVIDLAGHKITRTGTTGNGSAFDVKSGAVTIRNGTIDCTQDDAAIAKDGVYAITARSGANVTLADLTVTVDSQAGACVYPFAGATVAIESGAYANVTTEPYQYKAGWTGMAVNQANVAQQLITITGGSFSQVDPALGDDSAAEGAMSFIDEAYVTVSEGGAWVVHPAVTVTFADAKVSPAPAAQKIAKDSAAEKPADPEFEGWTFLGWFADGADTAFDFATPVAEDLALTAQWSINQYTITFDSAGGSAVDPITQDYATAVAAPANPTKEGHTFAGWSPAVPATMPAEDLTLVAQWTINQYTVRVLSDPDGTVVAERTGDFGQALNVSAVTIPTKAGYTFKAWSETIPTTIPARDVTIWATWYKNVAFPAEIASKVYNGAVQTADIAEADGLVVKTNAGGTNVAPDYPVVLALAEGDYIWADGSFEDKTYAFAITKATATVTAEAKSKTYGDADPEFTATVTGLQGEDTAAAIAYTLSRAAGETVGTYAITPAGAATQGNYDVVYVPADLTIAKRAITVTAADASKVGGNADPTFSASITAGSLAAGDEIAYTLQREAGETVGAYAIAPTVSITAAGVDKSANYEITLANGTFTIGGAAAMVISVADASTGATTTNYFATLPAAVSGATSGETVELLADVTLDARIEPALGTGSTLVIDLGGKTITRTGTSGNGSAFDVKSGAVTIRNGAIDCSQDDAAIAKDGVYAITARSGAAVTLADLTVTVDSQAGACVYPFEGATVAIESGTYANMTDQPYQYHAGWTGMAVNQANHQPGSLFTITGGTFSQVNPMLGDDSAAEGAMSFVHPDYYAVAGGGAFTVVPRIDIARATVTVKDDLVYDGTAQAGVASVAYGTTNLVEGTDYVVTYATNVDAGTETAVATLVGTNLWTGTQIAKFSISQKPLTVTAASDTKVYDGAALVKDAYTATALAEGDAFQTVAVVGSQTGVGASSNKVAAVAIANAAGTDVTANYDVTLVDGELVVTKAAMTITVAGTPVEKVYNGADQTVDVAWTATEKTSTGLFDEAKVVRAATQVTGKDVNTYAYGLAPAQFSYSDANVEATFEVADAALTITAAAATVITVGDNGEPVTTYYGTLAEALAAAKDGDTVQLLADVDEPAVAIENDITLDLNGHAWTVTPAEAGGTPGEVGIVAAVAVVDTATGGKGSIVGDIAVSDGGSLTLGGGAAAAAGSPSVGRVSVTGDGSAVAVEGGTVGGGVSVAEGGDATISGGTVNGTLAKDEADGSSISVSGGHFENDPSKPTDFVADGYVAVPGDPDGYDVIARQPIEGAVITIAENLTYTGLGQAGVTGVAVNGTNLVEGTDYVVVYADNVNAGEAAATVVGTNRWTGTITGTTFAIAKAKLTVTAPDGTVRRGADASAIRYAPAAVAYAGFVNGETASVLAAEATFGPTNYTAAARTGATFDVVASGAEAANYAFDYVDGTLTVVAGAVAAVDATEYDTIAEAVAAAGKTADGKVVTMLDDADAAVLLAFGDVLKIEHDGFDVQVGVANAVRYFVSSAEAEGVTTYTVQQLKADGLAIKLFDYEGAKLAYDMGTEENMAAMLPTDEPIWCTVVTATDLAATDWTAVESSRAWSENLLPADDPAGWTPVEGLDTTTSPVRFFRIAVTPFPLTPNETVEFK